MPNKDDWELQGLVPEQAMMPLQELSTLPVSLFHCYIVFPYKLDHFLDYLWQKMIDFVQKNNETLKWSLWSLKWHDDLFWTQT